MDNDLNTPGGVAVLFELAKELQRQGNILTHTGTTDADPQVLQQQWSVLVNLAETLGLVATPEEPEGADSGKDAEIEGLVAARNAAKQAKDFAEADRIRTLLKEQGISLIDKPGGVTDWLRD